LQNDGLLNGSIETISVGSVTAEVMQFEMQLYQRRFNVQRYHEHLCLHKHLIDIYGQQAGFKPILDIVQLTPVARSTSLANLNALVYCPITIVYRNELVL
jgi:hypothetical protein